MDSPFCSLSPLLQEDDEALLENTFFSNDFPDFQIPQALNTIGHISAFSSQRVEENLENKKKSLAIEDKKPSGQKNVGKKIMHRDVEKQRRQEMTALYSSLRSVLPPQLLKGKRSISDQLDKAATYIQDMQKHISELGMKRDELRKSHSENRKSSQIVAKVHPCGVGAEILITAETLVDIPLSRIMKMLLEEGAVVVSYTFTTTDGRLNYMIQSEVSADRGIDFNMLQRKISYVINTLI